MRKWELRLTAVSIGLILLCLLCKVDYDGASLTLGARGFPDGPGLVFEYSPPISFAFTATPSLTSSSLWIIVLLPSFGNNRIRLITRRA